jgi:hypothetical protein
MQRVSEYESAVFCGAAARLWRAAALCSGGGQPAGLAAASTSLFVQKVFDCKWRYTILRPGLSQCEEGMGAPALRAGAPSQRRPAPKGRWPPPKKKVYNGKWY